MTTPTPTTTMLTLTELSGQHKALSDPVRLRLVGLLQSGELCVCDLMAVLKLPQSTVSRHLAYLRGAGLAVGERRGKWMYYRLTTGHPDEAPLPATVALLRSLPEVRADLATLAAHLAAKTDDNCATP